MRLLIRTTSIVCTYLMTTFSTAQAALYMEPEIGVFGGKYQRVDDSMILGMQGGFSFGYLAERFQFGVEVNVKSFEVKDQGSVLHLTNFPIGIAFRYAFTAGWRLLFSWYWDDVLYKDFRFKFQQGFRLPKDYDVAYEGPGSWRVGISQRLGPNIYLNHSVFPQKYGRFKRREPVEMIGDIQPEILLMTYTATLSICF